MAKQKLQRSWIDHRQELTQKHRVRRQSSLQLPREINMRARVIAMAVAVTAAGTLATAQAPKRFNPMVELLAAKKPVFGLYAPSNRRFGGGPGGAGRGAAPAAPATPAPPDR